MNLIVDTNIAISSLITPGSNISKIIFRDLGKSALIAPSFMFEEILDKFQRIIKITGYSDEQLKELLYLLVKRIDFIRVVLAKEKHKSARQDLQSHRDY